MNTRQPHNTPQPLPADLRPVAEGLDALGAAERDAAAPGLSGRVSGETTPMLAQAAEEAGLARIETLLGELAAQDSAEMLAGVAERVAAATLGELASAGVRRFPSGAKVGRRPAWMPAQRWAVAAAAAVLAGGAAFVGVFSMRGATGGAGTPNGGDVAAAASQRAEDAALAALDQLGETLGEATLADLMADADGLVREVSLEVIDASEFIEKGAM
jgi:hypothetical protein